MKTRWLHLFIFFILSSGLVYVGLFIQSKNVESQSVLYQPYVLSPEKLWTVINEWRVSEGLQPFERSEDLCKIAHDRIKDGNDKHKGLYERYSNHPYSVTENQVTAKSENSALMRWLNSPPHRAALEKDWKYSCVATDGDYALQIFSNL